jgi:hypothetical protein
MLGHVARMHLIKMAEKTYESKPEGSEITVEIQRMIHE